MQEWQKEGTKRAKRGQNEGTGGAERAERWLNEGKKRTHGGQKEGTTRAMATAQLNMKHAKMPKRVHKESKKRGQKEGKRKAEGGQGGQKD